MRDFLQGGPSCCQAHQSILGPIDSIALQIDNGVPWTDTRKYFMIMPILLCVAYRRSTGPRARQLERTSWGFRSPPHIPAYPRLHPAIQPLSCRYLVTCYAVEWDLQHLWINSLVLLVCIVAKLPEMHGVRLFRINAARVD